ncbi:HET-domain-containing protein, partial [Periconia macrospinosa]
MIKYRFYDKLDTSEPHFRLVKIHPASAEDDPIRCSLFTTKIEGAPVYGALSYCWGDAKDVETITVCQETFLATKNLAAALRGLRYDDRDRIMWIDAIAICQSDNIEKKHQIPLMTRIYSDASQVVVWLGAGD